MDKFLVIDLEMDLRTARADLEKKYLTDQINNYNANKSKKSKTYTYNFLIYNTPQNLQKTSCKNS